jgi:hypothetical protein
MLEQDTLKNGCWNPAVRKNKNSANGRNRLRRNDKTRYLN